VPPDGGIGLAFGQGNHFEQSFVSSGLSMLGRGFLGKGFGLEGIPLVSTQDLNEITNL